MNHVLISGNLSREPEIRQTKAGLPVLGISLETNNHRKNEQTGEWDKYPNFISCSLFGSRAPYIAAVLHKGSKVVIEGKLRQTQWKAKDGSMRSKLEVVINSVEFLDRIKKHELLGDLPSQFRGEHGEAFIWDSKTAED